MGKAQEVDLDLNLDYLISSKGLATATGLEQLSRGAVSHDQITRSLNGTTIIR